MRSSFLKLFSFILATASTSLMFNQAHAEPTAAAKEEIQQLLNFVGQSGCQYIRNKKTHNPDEAVEHITRKYEHYYDDINTAEDFIRLSATASLVSGKPYSIECPGQAPQPSGEWLQTELKRMRS